jgi:hypothetical protein
VDDRRHSPEAEKARERPYLQNQNSVFGKN